MGEQTTKNGETSDNLNSLARYFFRDKTSGENLENGMEFHAAGVVIDSYAINLGSGKDLAVGFLHPFQAKVEIEWRAYSDVELYEVSKYEWGEALKLLENID